MKKIVTKEDKWTSSICNILKTANLGENIYVDVFVKLPYALEAYSFDECRDENDTLHLDINETDINLFETDMIIYEKKNGKIIPRVIIESKRSSISTHSAITYSQKAQHHKNVIPFLRYGIMIGNMGDKALPARLFKHGTNFDFLFSFADEVPSDKEKELFVSMVQKEVKYSRQMETILITNRDNNRTRFCMLQKEFHLEEV